MNLLDDLTCPECLKVFSSGQVMQRHQKTVHSREKPFACWSCKYATNRRLILRDHCHRQHDISYKEFKLEADLAWPLAKTGRPRKNKKKGAEQEEEVPVTSETPLP